MARSSRDEKERRLDRLAGSGQGSGGGLPLPDLFSALLNEVLDSRARDHGAHDSDRVVRAELQESRQVFAT